MSAPIRVAGAVVLLSALLAACSDAGETGGDRSSPAPAGPTAPTPGQASAAPDQAVDVASWVGDDLPTAAGRMARRGDLGIYYAEVDHHYTLVAIDIPTGTERWRQRVHQLDRVPGTVHTPVVDWDTGLVFAGRFEPEANPPLLGLFAYDLDGNEMWGSGVRGARLMRTCGDGMVCLAGVDGTVHTYRQDSGATFSSGGGVGRVLGWYEAGLVTANADDQLVELGRINAEGEYKRRWRHSVADLFSDEQAGDIYSPNGGWATARNDDAEATAVALYAFLEQAPDSERARREAARGGAVALVGDDGDVRGSWQEVVLCMTDRTSDVILLCEDLEVADGAGTVDGQPQPASHGMRVSAYRVTDVGQEWTAAMPGRIESLWRSSDDNLVVARPDGASAVVLDVEDGSTSPVSDRPELIVACDPDRESRDLYDLYGELVTGEGEQARYRRAYGDDVQQMCDASGTVIDPADLLATGALTPSWFGYHPGLEDDEEPQGADRWAVWVTPDGTLHGAGPAEDASGATTAMAR